MVLLGIINVVVSLHYYLEVVKGAFLLEPDEVLPPANYLPLQLSPVW
jgi:NADH:ubiquinone oxidoreductase subunit 2 (subunit N)